MSQLKKNLPEWCLRFGIAGTYLYSGYDLVMHPTAWHWAIRNLPQFMQGLVNQIGINTYLQAQGIIELLFAIILLAWFLPSSVVRIVSAIIALEMSAILFLGGLNSQTFRDMGLLGAALALFFLLSEKHNGLNIISAE